MQQKYILRRLLAWVLLIIIMVQHICWVYKSFKNWYWYEKWKLKRFRFFSILEETKVKSHLLRKGFTWYRIRKMEATERFCPTISLIVFILDWKLFDIRFEKDAKCEWISRFRPIIIFTHLDTQFEAQFFIKVLILTNPDSVVNELGF